MHLRPNTLLQRGKYKITRFIASGGFGCTYEGVNTMMSTRVAIKEFFPKAFCDRADRSPKVIVTTRGNLELVAKLRKKFNEEATVVHSMKHDNIVRVLDVFEENGTAYYVMEYVAGRSLHDIGKTRGALPEREAVGYIRQVADALRYVHSLNRLHLDIKPGNIMVDSFGRVKLIDFGASKHYDDQSGENTSTLLGVNTKGYAPIEQCSQSFTTFSPATDIYALGATLYKLLTGVTPPDATLRVGEDAALAPLPQGVSQTTRRAVEKAMLLRRKDRPQTIDEFLALLNGFATAAAPHVAPAAAARVASAPPRVAPAAPREIPAAPRVVAPATTPQVAPRVAPATTPQVAPRVAPAASPRVAPAVAPRVAPAASPRVAPAVAPRVATPADVRRQRRKWILIAAIAIVIVLIVFSVLNGGAQSTPEGVVAEYFDAVKNSDAVSAYALCCDEQGKTLPPPTPDQILEWESAQTSERTFNFGETEIYDDGNRARVKVIVTVGSDSWYYYKECMKCDDGKWRIYANSFDGDGPVDIE